MGEQITAVDLLRREKWKQPIDDVKRYEQKHGVTFVALTDDEYLMVLDLQEKTRKK